LNHSEGAKLDKNSSLRASPFESPLPLITFLPINSDFKEFNVADETISNSWSISFCISDRETDSITLALEFFSKPSLVNIWTSITVPSAPEGTLKEVSLTSEAFSPKIALRSFSSGDNWVSPFGVTFPTKISPAFTSAPIWTIPHSSNLDKAESPTFGMSPVISSG
jgi:hypothetical protein